MRLRILILDDDKIRHDAFKRIYAEHDVVSAYKYSEFVERLGETFDIIHLDHDLGDYHTADTYVDVYGRMQEYNGMHAVDKLFYFARSYIGFAAGVAVIVHSINSIGANMMVKTLRNAGFSVKWEPFGEVL